MGAKSQWPNAMPWGAKRASMRCAGETGAKRQHQLLEPSKARDARLEGCRERAVWQNGECGAVRIAQLRHIVWRHGAQCAVHSAVCRALAHIDRGGVQDAAGRPIHPSAAHPTDTGLLSTSCANVRSHAAPRWCQQQSRPSAQTQTESCTPCDQYACLSRSGPGAKVTQASCCARAACRQTRFRQLRVRKFQALRPLRLPAMRCHAVQRATFPGQVSPRADNQKFAS